MVKSRPRKTAAEKRFNNYASGADKPAGALNPKDPRNFKSITLPMNEYEYMRLKYAAEEADRGMLDFIRQALKTAIAKEVD